jgi:hypothetical protein
MGKNWAYSSSSHSASSADVLAYLATGAGFLGWLILFEWMEWWTGED